MKNRIVKIMAFILCFSLMLLLPIVGYAEGYDEDTEFVKTMTGVFFCGLGLLQIFAMLVLFFVLKSSKRKRAISCALCLNLAELVFSISVIGMDFELEAIVCVLYVLSILLLLIEFYESKSKVFDRAILYATQGAAMLITFIIVKTGADPSNLTIVMISCLVFSSIISIYQLLLLIFVCRKKEITNNESPQKGVLPTGYSSSKSFIATVIFLVLAIGGAILGIVFAEKLWIKIIIGVALFIVVFAFVMAKALLLIEKYL